MSGQLIDLVHPLLGATVTGVAVSEQGTLRVKLGASQLSIYTIAWRIDCDGVLAASQDPVELLAESVAVLNEQKLCDIRIEAPSLDTTWVFEKARLRVFPVYFGDDRDSAYWTARIPNLGLVVAGPGYTWRLG